MPITTVDKTININPSLISFKPRQILLANPERKPNMNKPSIPALKPEQKAFLLRSIAGYLKSNGLSKTLKKFLSEAQIEKDEISESVLDLEHMCCKYFETRDHGSTNLNNQKVQDLTDRNSKGEKADLVAGVETVSKKKKKRDDEDSNAIVLQMEDCGKVTDSNETEKQKTKEKRKRKKTCDPVVEAEQASSDVVKKPTDNEVSDPQLHEPGKKQKDKRKKKGKLDSVSLVGQATESTMVNGNSISLEEESVIVKGKKKKKGGSVKASGEYAADEEKKSSKKRKRSTSEENNFVATDKKEVDESKRRKTEGSDKPKGSDQVTELNASVGTNEHPGKEIKGGSDPVSFEKSGEKSASNKSTMKQVNGSAGPTTAKAFQRVNVEEVVFIDERLKDNSYWAKDGAEIGYGAKAQAVLGQVRGRDFRHEKTKKKRGSYRGGLIDLRSHSVKFNYSDED